jgi:ATP-binding cassette subfamily B protein
LKVGRVLRHFAIVFKAIGIARKVSPGLILRVALLCLLEAAAFGATSVVIGLSIGDLITHQRADWGPTAAVVGAAMLLVLLPKVLSPVRDALARNLGDVVDASAERLAMVCASSEPNLTWRETSDARALFVQVEGVGMRRFTLGQAVSGLAAQAVTYLGALGAAAVLGYFVPWQTLLLVLAWLLARAFLARDLAATIQLEAGKTEALVRSTYLYEEVFSTGPAKEMRLLGLGSWWADQFGKSWLDAMRSIWRKRRAGIWPATGVLALLAAAQLLTIFSLVFEARSTALSLTGFLVAAQAFLGVARLAELGPTDLQTRYGLQAVSAYKELKARTPERVPGTSARRTAADVSVSNLEFCYPEGSPVLCGVDLAIESGSCVAVVGENGEGKSTLMKVIAGLYIPTAGILHIDGTPLEPAKRSAWQRQIAGVFQDPLRLELSVRENILFGCESPPADLLAQIVGEVGLDKLIHELPEGWDTVLASSAAGGTSLSGGQWQRISLARALLRARQGARLLILDEPASYLDPRSEAAFNDELAKLRRGITTILVSHRFATVKRADRIAVLKHGQIAEFGSHTELMASDGHYARMFREQAAAFGHPDSAAFCAEEAAL